MSLEREPETGAYKNVTIYQDEVDNIVDGTLSKTLHRKLVSFSFHQCINFFYFVFFMYRDQLFLIFFNVVTSMQGQSMYLRSARTDDLRTFINY